MSRNCLQTLVISAGLAQFSTQETPAQMTTHEGLAGLSPSLKMLASDAHRAGQGSTGPTTAGAFSAGHHHHAWDGAHRKSVRRRLPGEGGVRGQFCMEQLGLHVQDSSAGLKPLSPSSEGPSQVEYIQALALDAELKPTQGNYYDGAFYQGG